MKHKENIFQLTIAIILHCISTFTVACNIDLPEICNELVIRN